MDSLSLDGSPTNILRRPPRQADQVPGSLGCLLHTPQEGPHQDRAPPRFAQERRYPPHCPHSHRMSSHILGGIWLLGNRTDWRQNNLIIGVTKGYKYKMRYVYAQYVAPIAHFPEPARQHGPSDTTFSALHQAGLRGWTHQTGSCSWQGSFHTVEHG